MSSSERGVFYYDSDLRLITCSIVALLDLADEKFGCSAFVMALDRSSPALGTWSHSTASDLTKGLGDLLHSLMYVGGTVVTSPPFSVDPAYVLVGLEI